MFKRLFRRKLAAVAFFGGIGILAYQLYTQEKRLHATVVLDLGASIRLARSGTTLDFDLLNAFDTRYPELRASGFLNPGAPRTITLHSDRVPGGRVGLK